MRSFAAICAVALICAVPRAQDRKSFDTILDTYVRDGFVYYHALKVERAKFDGYVASLADVNVDQLSREAQIAFWINAYNALTLKTIIDHYPISGRSKDYPSKSIRQIPGAFERLTHRVGRSTLTLDQIEQNMLSKYNDPRVYFALGRGAVGGGRLRSEAYTPELLESQLKEVAGECATRAGCVQLDRENNKLLASPIFSWREKDFVAAYSDKAPGVLANRTPLERAIVAFVHPRLLTIEKEYLEKNANTFQLTYQPFDWTLNDLTGRGGR
ncbi:MAG TPA: DUF547 domain-containing protein [Vicinamibacterales bacterium]|nr:DUF547 domain-containing protein [Vicinamibacterales bacterium]